MIPAVVGALGTIPKKLELYVEKGGMEVIMDVLQKVTIFGTAIILQKVFGEDVAV